MEGNIKKKILLKINYAYYQLMWELESFDPNTIEQIITEKRRSLQENPLGIEANVLVKAVPINYWVIERNEENTAWNTLYLKQNNG